MEYPEFKKQTLFLRLRRQFQNTKCQINFKTEIYHRAEAKTVKTVILSLQRTLRMLRTAVMNNPRLDILNKGVKY